MTSSIEWRFGPFENTTLMEPFVDGRSWGGARLDRPGWILGWSDGVWSGHREAVAEARLLCQASVPVLLAPTGPAVPQTP